MTIRVLVADDHPLFRDGVGRLLEESAATALVATVGSGEEAVAVAFDEHPDVVVMDLGMPGLGGVEASRQIVARLPDVAVLVLTMMDDDASVLASLRAGARGYLLKGARSVELLRAIEALAAGDVVIGAPLASRMMQLLAPVGEVAARAFPVLTAREHEILELVATGRDNSSIARRLSLSDKTVRNNVSAILTKLQVADRAAAVARARDAGLGTPAGH